MRRARATAHCYQAEHVRPSSSTRAGARARGPRRTSTAIRRRTRSSASWPRHEETMTTALVLIDLQNDYFPGGTMELAGSEEAVTHARTLLEAFRSRGLPLFHIQHIAKRPGATFFLPGTKGAEIHTAVAPSTGEPVVTKHFPSSF